MTSAGALASTKEGSQEEGGRRKAIYSPASARETGKEGYSGRRGLCSTGAGGASTAGRWGLTLPYLRMDQ